MIIKIVIKIAIIISIPVSMLAQFDNVIGIDSCISIGKSDMVKRGLHVNRYAITKNENIFQTDSLKKLIQFKALNYRLYNTVKNKFTGKKFYYISFERKDLMDSEIMYFIDCFTGMIILVGGPNLPPYR